MTANPHYHGDLRHRPRLAFDARDSGNIARTVSRISRQVEPWASAYQTQLKIAQSGAITHSAGHKKAMETTDKWNRLYEAQIDRGAVAAARALVAWLYLSHDLDPEWAPLTGEGPGPTREWALKQVKYVQATLFTMVDNWPGELILPMAIDRGIVAADALVMHCLAFDLLAAIPKTIRGSLSVAERRIADFAADFARYYKNVAELRNNHCVRIASALGIAAITVNVFTPPRREPGPAQWMNTAYSALKPGEAESVLEYQGSTGAWAEGTNYYQYSFELLMPFVSAYTRFLGGAGVPFMRSQLITELVRWSVLLRMPDSRRPMIDDAKLIYDGAPAYFLSQMQGGARSLDDQRLFLWDWRRTLAQAKAADAGSPELQGRHGIFLLGTYDPPQDLVDAVEAMASPAEPPTQFLPERGQAVLRTDWSADAAYLVVQAQHGDVRTHGSAHEIPANGSYCFHTRGDLITIEPGYLGYAKVAETNRARDHSIVVVNGEGPTAPSGFSGEIVGGTDTFIVDGPRTVAQAQLRAVEVRSSYRDADIVRTLALVGQDYVFVEDRCHRKLGKATFTTQVQTNAGSGEEDHLDREGAVVRYRTNGAKLPVCVAATASKPLDTSTAWRHSDIGVGPQGHRAIEYAAEGSSVNFLTAIAVGSESKQPAVEALSVAGGLALRVEVEGHTDVVVSNPEKRTLEVPACAGTRAFSTQASLVVMRFAGDGEAQTLWSV